MKINFKQKNGYVLLLAVILVSIILAMAIGIANVSLKQLYFTKTAKESHLAFFAADTGGECALYHYKYGAGVFSQTGLPPISFDCGGTSFNNINSTTFTGNYPGYNFQIDVGSACADVSVIMDKPNTGDVVIESRGYNVTCQFLLNNPTAPRKVERTLQYCFEATPNSCSSLSSNSSYPGLTSGSTGLVGSMIVNPNPIMITTGGTLSRIR